MSDAFWYERPQRIVSIFVILFMAGLCISIQPVLAQNQNVGNEAQQEVQPLAPSKLSPVREIKKPIIIEYPEGSLEERLNRFITLDVRQMNLVDVLKFLSLKGEFNMITSSQVAGRVTLNLKNVLISDTLDIVLISNNMAYYVEKDIVYIMSSVEYEAMFGKKFNDKNKVEIVQLQYAKPSYVLAALDNIKSDLGRIIIDEDTGSVVMIDTADSIKELKLAIERLESPLEAVVYSLQYANAQTVADKLSRRMTDNAVGDIETDERTNQIIVKALPGRRIELESLIKSLDAKTKEVMIDVRVLQVTFKPQLDYGIDWELDFRKSPHNILRRTEFRNIFLNDDSLSTDSNLRTNFTKVGIGDFTKNQFDLALRALKQVSDTKLLSNPKILVTNNQEAKIHVGDTIPYIISTTSGTGDNAITSEDVRFVDVGIKLNVTPTINDEGYITMSMKPEISSVVARITSQGGGIPQVNKTEVETTVLVKDGMSIVLGGLKKENKVLTTKGVPFLMDVPYLNKLFSSRSESVEATEIVILITPHIVEGNEDYLKDREVIKPAKEFSLKGRKENSQEQALRLKR